MRVRTPKVDFVKVRVWIGKHYHVLSRYVVSHLLSVTKIPKSRAIKIVLDLKKGLVDENKCDVPLWELENRLFAIMRNYGYGQDYVARYRMMSRFHQERIPMVIFITGTASLGKSVIANRLAAQLNLPTVLQTKVVYTLLCSMDSSMDTTPIYLQKYESDEVFINEYKARCRRVRKSLLPDLKKTFQDGKTLIVEGLYLDPSLYRDVVNGYICDDEKEWTTWQSSDGDIKTADGIVCEDTTDCMHGEVYKKLQKKANRGSLSFPGEKRAVVVPFLLGLTPDVHAMYSHNRFVQYFDDIDKPSPSDVLHKLRLVDSYIKKMGVDPRARFVPVDLDISSISESVKILHDVCLDRIATAVESLQPVVPPTSQEQAEMHAEWQRHQISLKYMDLLETDEDRRIGTHE